MASPDPGRSIQIVKLEGNKLQLVGNEFLNILTEVGDKKVFILSMNGRQRAGKSFMMSQCVKYLSKEDFDGDWVDAVGAQAFRWATDAERITEGIQMWSKPFYIEQEDETIAILLLDCQGLLDHSTSNNLNALLFTFSNLISSVFVYNEIFNSEDVLDYLLLFLKFTNVTSRHGHAGQKVIFLRRDFENADEFSIGYHDDYTEPPGSPGNLKKDIFDANPRQSNQAQETRREIAELSNCIGVYALPPPLEEPNPNNTSFDWGPSFREEVINFVQWVLSHDQIKDNVKKVLGSSTTGKQLHDLVKIWAEALSKTEELPDVVSLEAATVGLLGTQMVDKSKKLFEEGLVAFMDTHPNGVPLPLFHSTLANLVAAAETLFKESEHGMLGQEFATYNLKLTSVINEIRTSSKLVNDNRLRLATEKADALKNSENQERIRLEAAKKAKAAADSAKIAQQQAAVVKADLDRRRNARIACAKLEVDQAQESLDHARSNLRSIQDNTGAFASTVTITTKHRNRGPFGIVLSPSYSHRNEARFNSEGYNQAVQIAQQAVNNAEARYTTAINSLNAANNS